MSEMLLWIVTGSVAVAGSVAGIVVLIFVVRVLQIILEEQPGELQVATAVAPPVAKPTGKTGPGLWYTFKEHEEWLEEQRHREALNQGKDRQKAWLEEQRQKPAPVAKIVPAPVIMDQSKGFGFMETSSGIDVKEQTEEIARLKAQLETRDADFANHKRLLLAKDKKIRELSKRSADVSITS